MPKGLSLYEPKDLSAESEDAEEKNMRMIIKTAWRNLFRQKRRTLITVTAMAVSLMVAIPTWGLVDGLSAQMLDGITGMELGHIQIHDSAYAKGPALQSTLRRPKAILRKVRGTGGVSVAAPRVHGSALGSHDVELKVTLTSLDESKKGIAESVRFGTAIDSNAPWRKDVALACEALVGRAAARKNSVVVGTVLTHKAARPGGRCERVRIVGLLDHDFASDGEADGESDGEADDEADGDADGGQGSPDAEKAKGDSGKGHSRKDEASRESGLVIGLHRKDMEAAFGVGTKKSVAVLRHAAPLSIEGIEPESEKKVTFMAEKIVEGRYLGKEAKGEMVVGKRLAETLRLSIGDKIFVQAASLDQTRGDFYRNFTVVGIYRTGVDMLDRIRVFIHIADAQGIMSLGERAHEIVVLGPDGENTAPLAKEIKKAISGLGLHVTSQRRGKRAGSLPLPGPIYAYQNDGDGDSLIVPHDLKRRFDGIKGVAGLAARVYGETEITAFRESRAGLVEVSTERLNEVKSLDVVGRGDVTSCSVIVDRRWSERHGVKKGVHIMTREGGLGDELPCPRLHVSGTHADSGSFGVSVDKGSRVASEPAESADPAERAEPTERAEPAGGGVLPVFLIDPRVKDAEKKTGATDEDDLFDSFGGLEEGNVTLVLRNGDSGGAGGKIRFVGVETSLEPRLSGLDKKVTKGGYFKDEESAAETGISGGLPVLLRESEAKSLGLSPGGEALLSMRNSEGKAYDKIILVAGVLDDNEWERGLPPLVLSYYDAQQIHAVRLNAKAHELILIPKEGADIEKLVGVISANVAPVVRTWQEISPDMAKLIETQDIWTGIMLFVIFVMAAMTVMNTMLMAVWERTKEFGVLKSIGMKPFSVFSLIMLEAMGLAFFAVLLGGAVGFGLNHYLVTHGLDLTAFTGGFTYQGTFIDPVWKGVFSLKIIFLPVFMTALVCLIVSFYPAMRAARLEPVKALRHET